MNLNKFGLGINIKRDYDAILLGLLVGAIVVPHVPVINDVVGKVNKMITDKVGM